MLGKGRRCGAEIYSVDLVDSFYAACLLRFLSMVQRGGACVILARIGLVTVVLGQ